MKKQAVDAKAQEILNGYFGSFAEQLTRKIYNKSKSFLQKKSSLEDIEPSKIMILPVFHNENENEIRAEFVVKAHGVGEEDSIVAIDHIFSYHVDKSENKLRFVGLDLNK